MNPISYGKKVQTASISSLVAISLAFLDGCGATAAVQSAPSPEKATPSSAVSTSPPTQTSRVLTQSTPTSNSGPSITLSGTLSPDHTALFPAWVGGTTASGQWVWVPVTVQLDSGAQMSMVSGSMLTAAGTSHTPDKLRPFTELAGPRQDTSSPASRWYPRPIPAPPSSSITTSIAVLVQSGPLSVRILDKTSYKMGTSKLTAVTGPIPIYPPPPYRRLRHQIHRLRHQRQGLRLPVPNTSV